MDNNNSEEICWKFNFTAGATNEVVAQFLEDFTFSFVEEKGWYCGGGIEMGMYDLSQKSSKHDLLRELLKDLSKNKEIEYSIELII